MSNPTNSSIQAVCGDFEDPEVPDLGCCNAAKITRDCEAPTVPELSEVSYDPDATPPFTVT